MGIGRIEIGGFGVIVQTYYPFGLRNSALFSHIMCGIHTCVCTPLPTMHV